MRAGERHRGAHLAPEDMDGAEVPVGRRVFLAPWESWTLMPSGPAPWGGG